ncbi:MAG: hypothetical protein ABIJ31_09185 [Pseudomonadota bacterium]
MISDSYNSRREFSLSLIKPLLFAGKIRNYVKDQLLKSIALGHEVPLQLKAYKQKKKGKNNKYNKKHKDED